MDLPQEFLQMIGAMSPSVLDQLPQVLTSTDPSVAVRLNPAKPLVAEPFGESRQVPWCPEGRLLGARPTFTLDARLHQGVYYVQDPSSMIMCHILRHLTDPDKPVRYLDACAAPGGKTTCAAATLPHGSLIVANEYVSDRATVLRENLIKWGYPWHTVTQGDVSRFAASKSSFDIVAADVPCSGEGMMRKDAVAVNQWSPRLMEQCAARQRAIVAPLWEALAPGGYFIYSTCTFNRVENEQMLQHMVEAYGAEPLEVPLAPEWGIAPGIDTPYPCMRFIPGRIDGEGLFVAVMRKPGSADGKATSAGGRRMPRSVKVPAGVRELLKNPDEVLLGIDPRDGGSTVVATPLRWLQHPWAPHVPVATLKGRDLLPTHRLLMSPLFRADVLPKAEIDHGQALEYLRGQTIALPSNTPRGPLMLTYGSLPLGLVKNLGSRANNLYPRPWRIRM